MQSLTSVLLSSWARCSASRTSSAGISSRPRWTSQRQSFRHGWTTQVHSSALQYGTDMRLTVLWRLMATMSLQLQRPLLPETVGSATPTRRVRFQHTSSSFLMKQVHTVSQHRRNWIHSMTTTLIPNSGGRSLRQLS